MTPDQAALADLAAFARVEVMSRDVEPWADVLRFLYADKVLDEEAALWLLTLYNTYDSLGSACAVFARWPTPYLLLTALDFPEAAQYECTQERRNLRGGKVLARHASYGALIAGGDWQQSWWLTRGLGDWRRPELSPTDAWEPMTAHLRRVWGVGRQSAFEWAEFLAKVMAWPLAAPHAQLWESEGPRRSLQRLYGNPRPTSAWLDEAAIECKAFLETEGVPLSWLDFETIICDFNVMRDGRYYPGRHLAALREEIDGVTGDLRPPLERAWRFVVPPEWQDIPPGIDKAKLPVYRDSGKLLVTA